MASFGPFLLPVQDQWLFSANLSVSIKEIGELRSCSSAQLHEIFYLGFFPMNSTHLAVCLGPTLNYLLNIILNSPRYFNFKVIRIFWECTETILLVNAEKNRLLVFGPVVYIHTAFGNCVSFKYSASCWRKNCLGGHLWWICRMKLYHFAEYVSWIKLWPFVDMRINCALLQKIRICKSMNRIALFKFAELAEWNCMYMQNETTHIQQICKTKLRLSAECAKLYLNLNTSANLS
jgi:hypothetical protein